MLSIILHNYEKVLWSDEANYRQQYKPRLQVDRDKNRQQMLMNLDSIVQIIPSSQKPGA